MIRRLRLPSVLLTAALVLAAASALWAQGPPAFTVEEMLKLKRVSDPQLSPDGTRIAFVQTDVNLETNVRANTVRIVSVTGEPTDVRFDGDRPRWSPDGKQLAWVGSNGQVVATSFGPVIRDLTSLATGASGVTWSSDGKWIAFVSDVFPECTGNVVGEAACNEALLKKQAASKVKAHLTDGLMYRHWTAWKGAQVSHLFVAPVDRSSPPRDVTPGTSDVPPFSLGGPEDYAFSPDAKEIAFAKKTDKVEAISTNSDIFIVDLTNPNAATEAAHDRAGRRRRPAVFARRPGTSRGGRRREPASRPIAGC